MPEIRRATIDEVFDHADAPALFAEYHAEGSIAGMPPPNPQRAMYQQMEITGALHVLVAVEGDRLLGFLFLLVSVNPHYGVRLAVAESYFVAAAHRKTGAGLRLLHAAEDAAQLQGAVVLLLSAPAGGRLAEVLGSFDEYERTNEIFCRRLG